VSPDSRIGPSDDGRTEPGVWLEREPFPVEAPPDPADAAALLDYQTAASRALATVRDTRRGGAAVYVTYHWGLSFYGEYALAPLLKACSAALAGSGLLEVPHDRVHLPLLRIGAAEEVGAAELHRIEWAARDWAPDQHQFRVAVGPPALGPGGVRLCVSPWDELLPLRHGLRRATRDVLGLRPWLRELIPFRPHVPVAYAGTELAAAVLRDRLADLAEHRPISLRVRRLTLLRITRAAAGPSWFTVADMALGKRTAF
jgi:hypothetical protein